jgi:rhodanese-related sulfurtransferase
MASNRISPEEVNARVLAGEPVVFLDTRNSRVWDEAEWKVPGAVRVPADDVESHLDEIDKNTTVITYCT